MRGRLATLLPYLSTALVAAWVTRTFWWPGRYVVSFDTYTYSGPNTAVTEHALRDGRLPLWNDAIFGGVTHLGNPQAGALYPPRLITLLLEDNRAMGLLVALHVALLGLGMVAFVRRLGLLPPAAAFAGAAAVLNGAVLTRSIQFEQILVIAWAPWLLTAIHATLSGARPRVAATAIAAVTAAMLVAGHPQMVFQSIVLAIAATAGFAISSGGWRRLPYLAAGVGLGALMALPQLVAAAVATSESVLTQGRDEHTLLDPTLSLVPGAGARALLGTLGDRHPGTFVGNFESIAFLGVVLLVVAVIGAVDAIADRTRRPWAISLTLCAGLCLLWSFGPRTILYTVTSDVVPWFDIVRVSARWLTIVVLIAVVFAAVGLDRLARGGGRRELITAVATVAAGVAVIAVRRLDGEAAVAAGWLAVAVIAVLGVAVATVVRSPARNAAAPALAVVAVVELGLMSVHSLPQLLATDVPFTSPSYRLPTTNWLDGRPGFVISLTDDLREPSYGVPGLRPNANVLVDIRSIDGYDGGVQITERWAAALRRLQPEPATDFPLRNNVLVPLDPVQLGRLGVHYVLIDRNRPIADIVPGWIGPRAVDASFEVWENPAWIGEAIAWSAADAVDPQTAPDLLRTDVDDMADIALVDDPGHALTCDAPCPPIGLTVDRRRPEHVVVTADLADPAIVTLDQQFDAGWRVEVDGADQEVLEVDGLVVGVEVSAGRHEITWRYRPTWLSPTLVVGASAALVTLAVAWCGPRARAVRHSSGASTLTDSPP